MREPYALGTEVQWIGKISAVRSGHPREYMLIDQSGTVTWLDEPAVTELLKDEA